MGIRTKLAERFFGDVIEERLRESETAMVDAVEEKVAAQVEERLRESVLPYEGVDSDEYLYRRLTEQQKDLSPLTRERQLKIAYYLWVVNPGARDFIEKVVDFVCGEGVKVRAETAEVQQVIDRFWDSDINAMDLQADAKVRELAIYGEQFYPTGVNQWDGSVELGYVDPLDVENVLLNRDNLMKVDAIKIKGRAVPIAVINRDPDPNSKSYGKLVGDTHFFHVNKVSNAKRGISDLLCVADWLDAYDQFLMNIVEKSAFSNAWIWDVTLEGANDEAIAEFLKKNKEPHPGSMRAHNERVKWNAVMPQLAAKDNTDNARLIRGNVHWGTGMPEHWAGFGDYANRATAVEMGEPPMKKLTRRQRYIRHCFAYMVDHAIDQAILAGWLREPVDPEKAREWRKFEVIMPDMSVRDISKIAVAVQQFSSGLMVALQNNLISPDTAVILFATLTGQLGPEIDPEKELKAIEELEKAAEREREKLSADAVNSVLDQMAQGPPMQPNQMQPKRPAREPLEA